MCRTQLLLEVLCIFGQQFTNVRQALKQQLPFCRARKRAGDKCVRHPYKATMVHKLSDTDHEARLNFVKWYLHGVLCDTDHEARLNFMNWYLHGVLCDTDHEEMLNSVNCCLLGVCDWLNTPHTCCV